MNPIKAYKYCIRCSGGLKKKRENLLICKICNFEFYINPSPCNAAIIENDKGEIMLVKRKFDPQKGLWDLPGGFINAGEDFAISVKREVKEELNLDIDITRVVGLYKDKYLYQGITGPILSIVVSARITSGNIKVSDDISGCKYFPKQEVLKQELAFSSMKSALEDYINK